MVHRILSLNNKEFIGIGSSIWRYLPDSVDTRNDVRFYTAQYAGSKFKNDFIILCLDQGDIDVRPNMGTGNYFVKYPVYWKCWNSPKACLALQGVSYTSVQMGNHTKVSMIQGHSSWQLTKCLRCTALQSHFDKTAVKICTTWPDQQDMPPSKLQRPRATWIKGTESNNSLIWGNGVIEKHPIIKIDEEHRKTIIRNFYKPDMESQFSYVRRVPPLWPSCVTPIHANFVYPWTYDRAMIWS